MSLATRLVLPIAAVAALSSGALSTAASQVPATARPAPQVLVTIDRASYGLGSYSDLAVSASGVLAVAPIYDNAIRFFSPQGVHIATAGRKGDGPGEFHFITAMGWNGDTLWVADHYLARLTLLSSSGVVLRSLPIPVAIQGALPRTKSELRVPWVAARFPNGDLLMSATRSGRALPGEAAAFREVETWLMRIGVDGSREAMLAKVPRDGCVVRQTSYFQEEDHRFQHCPATLFAAARDGSTIAFVKLKPGFDSIAKFKLTVLTGSGARLFEKTISARATRATPIVRRTEPDSSAQKSPLSRLDAQWKPQTYWPVVYDLKVALNGDIWLGLTPPSDTVAREWRVFSRKGEPRGTLTLSKGSRDAWVPESRGLWALTEYGKGVPNLQLHASPE
ncbi:MAG: hypothetical protein V4558_08465 [Gemmatimonadota bacterium]